MESQAEWTFEGGPEMERVGAAGNRTRYQSGMYLKVHVKVDAMSI